MGIDTPDQPPLAGVAPQDVPAPAADTISAIAIQGNQRIEADTVRSYLTLAVGDVFDATRADASLKALFATGLFADVTIDRQGTTLIVRVVENPIINRLTFEGNSHLTSDKLSPEVQERELSVFSRAKAQEDADRLRELYERSGRFNATVRPRIVRLPQNRVDLVFEVKEGDPTYVTRIDFLGNKNFSSSVLKDTVLTKEDRWWRLLSTNTTYDPDRLTYDQELLRRFYLHNGYADFRVVSGDAELTPDRKNFFLTFMVQEGQRYKFGKIGLDNAIPDLKVEALRPLVKINTGDWYDADQVQSTIKDLTATAANQGYAFATVKPVVNQDPTTHTIDITFEIEQAQRVFISRVNITGNVRTVDKVIRREMVIAEGDAFSADKLDRSRQRINDLNFFSTVDVTNTPSAIAPDMTDVNVHVAEKSTGTLNFGLGWSSTYGPLVNVGATENDLLGSGKTLSVSGQLALRQSLFNVGYTDPYFLDRHLIAGVDMFSENDKLNNVLDYDTGTDGFDLHMGYYYNQFLRQDWKYTGSLTNIHDVQAGASPLIFQEAGVTTLSQLSQTVTLDHRDSKVEPTKGYYLSFGNDLAGLGGTDDFLRTNVSAGIYYPLADQWILLTKAGGGYVVGLGDREVLINQRYYLGGDSLRGFRQAGISPRDASTLDPLGAVWDYTGSLELTFPTGAPKEIGIKGKAFIDAGSVGGSDPHIPKDQVVGSGSLRLSTGLGLGWESPVGPLAVTFGFPILRQKTDQEQVLSFNFGTRF